MPDTKLPVLTTLSAPALDDLLYAVDVSDTTDDASGSSRSVSFERLIANLVPSICQGRLTTETGVAVSASDRTSQSTLYFTPSNGNRIALYDGTRWGLFAFTERSLALSGLTSGKNYDVFLYNNSGTLTLELSAAWTNDTTRADSMTTQDGIYVKSGATTRRYLGTIRTTGTTTSEDSQSKRFVWNAYNQFPRHMLVTESTNSWTYNSTTPRYANNSSANRVEIVVGLSTFVEATVLAQMYNGNGVAAGGTMGIGFDSSSAFSGLFPAAYSYSTTSYDKKILTGRYSTTVAAGYHFLAWIEATDATNTTFMGDDNKPATCQSGLYATVLG